MNWTIDRVNDCENLTEPEIKTRSLRLNSCTACATNFKNDLSRLSPIERSQWKRNNSPRSLPNTRLAKNDQSIMLQRRVHRNTQEVTLLSAGHTMKNLHGNLGMEMVIALKNGARHLNNRAPHVNAEMNDDVIGTCDEEVQHQILNMSWLNLEKLFHLKLQRANMNSNESGRGMMRGRFASLPHKIKMKMQIFTKMSVDLSLMSSLFGLDLNSSFLEFERTNDSSKIKIFHMKSLHMLNEVLSTGTGDNVISHCTCKTPERWHYYATKVSFILFIF